MVLAHFAPQSQQPLLDVACATGGRVIAVGAHGVCFISDGRWKGLAGEHLGRTSISTKSLRHAWARVYRREGGHLYRSDDSVRAARVESGYDGSFFG